MSQKLDVQARGLQTQPNPLTVPDGSLSVATNVVIHNDNIVESRRGLMPYGTSVPDGTYAEDMYWYADRVYMRTLAGNLYYDSDGAGTWVQVYGNYDQPSAELWSTCNSAQFEGSLYLTTADGIQKLGGAGAQRRIAKGTYSAAIDANGALPTDNQVAYQAVLSAIDDSGREIVGPPMPVPITVINTSGSTQRVALELWLPGVSNLFVSIYRTRLSGGAAILPSSEFFLVYKGWHNSGATYSLNDYFPDETLGAALYTNPSQQGARAANFAPPISEDLALWKNVMFYANVRYPLRATFTLRAIGSVVFGVGNGLVANDIIAVAGSTYTFKAVPAGSYDVLISTGGTLAENIDATMGALVDAINNTIGSTVGAYYAGSGTVVLERSSALDTTLSVTSDRLNAFDRSYMVVGSQPSSGTLAIASSQAKSNGIAWSKEGIPEAVTLEALQLVGGAGAIKRILATENSLYVFKEDGTYRLAGTPSNFVVDEVDRNLILTAPRTLRRYGETIIGWFNKGVCQLSDSGGVDILVGRPIQDLIDAVPSHGSFEQTTACVHEAEKDYLIFYRLSSESTVRDQALCYNSLSTAWTKWDVDAQAGVDTPDGDLFLCYDSGARKQRRAFTPLDYVDDASTAHSLVESVAGDGLSIVIDGPPEIQDFLPGWGYYDDNGRYAVVVDIVAEGFSATRVYLDRAQDYQSGPATFYRPIQVDLEWVVNTAANGGVQKVFREMTWAFDDEHVREMTARFATNAQADYEDVTLHPSGALMWGAFAWGGEVWGAGQRGLQIVRQIIPQRHQRATWIKIGLSSSVPFSNVRSVQRSLQVDGMTERQR